MRIGLAVLVGVQVHRTLAQNGVDDLYLDRFNYYGTEVRNDGFTDYGPEDWGKITCREGTRERLDSCEAYPDKWHAGQGWAIEDNYCRSCPLSAGSQVCGRHHQSPINLERNRGLGFWENDGIAGDDAHEMANECIDIHWMKYSDSTCTLRQLEDQDAFTVERHGLRITQPLTVNETDHVQLECVVQGVGRKFAAIDFSKGFSDWWHLSHIDFKTPSEHAQEGKIYDAEIQLHHFYSVTAAVAGVNNQIATVAIFMQAYENAAPWRYLDKVICQWRRHEFKVREECGLAPVAGTYPGCFPLSRKLRQASSTKTNGNKKFKTVQDLLVYNSRQQRKPNATLAKLIMDDVNFGPQPDDKTDEEWEEFFEKESAKHKADNILWEEMHRKHNNNTDDAHEAFRRLIEGEEDLPWFNYFPMLGVRTEYYFRYSGSQTVPPCYGNFIPESREETNHWRVMKDPIRIHPRQLKEMKRLIAERISPKGDPVNQCKPDTAAEVKSDGDVIVARPLQYWHPVHFKTFCECKDWRSRWPEDRAWCDGIKDPIERFYNHPYNFNTSDF